MFRKGGGGKEGAEVKIIGTCYSKIVKIDPKILVYGHRGRPKSLENQTVNERINQAFGKGKRQKRGLQNFKRPKIQNICYNICFCQKHPNIRALLKIDLHHAQNSTPKIWVLLKNPAPESVTSPIADKLEVARTGTPLKDVASLRSKIHLMQI